MSLRRQLHERDPQYYHGVQDAPMGSDEWELIKTSDQWLREPLLWRDQMKKQLRLIVNRHIGRWRGEAA